MPRVKQRTPELRDRVVDVAVSTLCEDGMSGFTTRRVAERAGTSVPAVYELFSDKDGLLRAVFFEGFRRLGGELVAIPETTDELGDLRAVIPVFRRFCLDYPPLARVMFSRPFQELDPAPDQLASAPTVREILVGKVKRCVDTGLLAGDPVDISHVLLALAQGLAVQEAGRWLGTSTSSVDRRWDVGVQAVLAGFHA
ncbi:TetR family transcriptional regulator [Mycolicibacterium aromaticivorans JS19b1 = JCM 16368]|uniref:TetR family transcriptional regulator n=1 Tax=Mycolicibacterium aromaticivorans JS19b1 = JCM 16368 TaxID=1440774 RepID=A0A064CK63_9MYCO|nr:TetR/AcrR family transcriptional regulator [Mycolicibacterium aromaticivorans]KDF00716.1 TetR family transcriptional regulator [Mycolicibacterium aromaticivorans JS19b1 = JCM 16368]